MNITIQVPSPLRSCCGGAAELSLSASSVRAALEQVERDHPELYRSICNETGVVRPHVNLFVNSSLVHGAEGLDAPLAAGDVVSVFQAVSGG